MNIKIVINFLLPIFIIYSNLINWFYKLISVSYTFKILFQYSQPSLPFNFIIYNSYKPDNIKTEFMVKKLNYFLFFGFFFGGGFSYKLLLLL